MDICNQGKQAGAGKSGNGIPDNEFEKLCQMPAPFTEEDLSLKMWLKFPAFARRLYEIGRDAPVSSDEDEEDEEDGDDDMEWQPDVQPEESCVEESNGQPEPAAQLEEAPQQESHDQLACEVQRKEKQKNNPVKPEVLSQEEPKNNPVKPEVHSQEEPKNNPVKPEVHSQEEHQVEGQDQPGGQPKNSPLSMDGASGESPTAEEGDDMAEFDYDAPPAYEHYFSVPGEDLDAGDEDPLAAADASDATQPAEPAEPAEPAQPALPPPPSYLQGNICRICRAQFVKAGELRCHMEQNHQDAYKCRHCPKSFPWDLHRQRHEAHHHKDLLRSSVPRPNQPKGGACPTIKFLDTLPNSSLKQKKEKPARCSLCDMDFENLRSLSLHNKSEHTERLTCVCKKTFVKKAPYEVHRIHCVVVQQIDKLKLQ